MNLNDYQAEAMGFRLLSAGQEYARLNLAGEVGEYLSLFAKGLRDGRKFDFDQQAKKELGDILWQVAACAADHGFTLEDVAATNINKLGARKQVNTIQGSGDNR